MHITDIEKTRSQEIRKTIPLYRNVLIIGVILVIAKFIAWHLTHSNAILSDALESIVNILAGSFGLFALYFSARPRNLNFPYGHSKIEFLSGGLEGMFILVAGVFLVIKGGYDIWHPADLQKLDIGLLITLLTGAVHGTAGLILIQRGRAMSSVIYEATGKHLLSDMLTTMAILVGLTVVWLTGWFVLDSVIAMIFGAYIATMGIKLIRQSVSGILDEAPRHLINAMIESMNQRRRDAWIDIHNFRFIRYGRTLHIDCHMTLPWYYTVQEAHDEMELLQDAFSKLGGREWHVEVFIHQDPCIPEACRYCLLSECPVRKHPFEQKIDWTDQRLAEDRKHALAEDESKNSGSH